MTFAAVPVVYSTFKGFMVKFVIYTIPRSIYGAERVAHLVCELV